MYGINLILGGLATIALALRPRPRQTVVVQGDGGNSIESLLRQRLALVETRAERWEAAARAAEARAAAAEKEVQYLADRLRKQQPIVDRVMYGPACNAAQSVD